MVDRQTAQTELVGASSQRSDDQTSDARAFFAQESVFSTFQHLRVDIKHLTRLHDEDAIAGGDGTVWFAIMGTSRKVAVKELRQSGKWNARSRAAIVRFPSLRSSQTLFTEFDAAEIGSRGEDLGRPGA